MKNKFFILLAALLLIALAQPTPASAHGWISGQVVDGKTFNGWTWGCDIEIVGNVTGVIWGSQIDACSYVDGTFSIYAPPTFQIGSNYFYRVGSNSDTQLEVHVYPYAGPQGTPDPVVYNIPVAPNFNPYSLVSPIILDAGPNAVEISGFNATNAVAGWVPYVLVIGSLALLSGTVAVARKRRS